MDTIKLNQFTNGWAGVADIDEFTEYVILAVWDCGASSGCIALDIGAEAPKEWDATIHPLPVFGLYGKEQDGQWTALHDEPVAAAMDKKVRELVVFEVDHGLLDPGVTTAGRRKVIPGYLTTRTCASRAGAGLDGTPMYYQPQKRKVPVKAPNPYGWD